MARRPIHKLTPFDVKNTSKPGLHGDGRGLYLHVGPTGTKSWVMRYMLHGKAHEMGLGPYPTFGLADARKKAEAARRQKDGNYIVDKRGTTGSMAGIGANRHGRPSSSPCLQ